MARLGYNDMRGAVKEIMDGVGDALVITSVGTISREVFAYKDRPENMYIMGAMGCALGVGIGLAMNTEKMVVVIAGDGDMLMGMGTLALLNWLVQQKGLRNIRVYIIDNHSYAATGGQQTCSTGVAFDSMAPCEVVYVRPEKTSAPRIALTPVKIWERFCDAVAR